jgi:hypothetical protein
MGPAPPEFMHFDRDLVVRQRTSRGNLVGWAFSALAPVCDSCGLPLYEHANAYQDAMLDAVLQLSTHLGPQAHRLHEVALPAWCGGTDFLGCMQLVRGPVPDTFGAQVDLFRRKAQLVDVLGTHLDDLRAPEATAYMACRAVLAARIDFELTDDDRNNQRGEHKRRSEQFFRVEASVGMD